MDQDYQRAPVPPPELVEDWCRELFGCDDKPEIAAYELARIFAAWGYRKAREDARRIEARELSAFGLLEVGDD